MVDLSTLTTFNRDRTLIPGPAGHTISGPDWTDAQARLTAVEALAGGFNPMPVPAGAFMSTISHGLGRGDVFDYSINTWTTIFTPIFVPEMFDANRMSVYVTTGVTWGQATLALYDGAGTHQQTFGIVDTNSAGWKIAEMAVGTATQVSPGLNWLAVRSNDVAGVGLRFFYPAHAMFNEATSMLAWGAYIMAATPPGAMPTTMPTANALDIMPYLGLGAV